MSYETRELTEELSQNFIDYAMAVNSDRAIPDAKSGLKPVARRILYGAYVNGRTSNKPFVKSARVVGDIMGSLHPHGNSSIYEALVRLSQPWVMRYPLMDFHGNQGNIAGDGPAAERYTETRLEKLSEEGMLAGIKKKNVSFIPNYDDTMDEPITLPAVFPNLLCNPNSGIGVALASGWCCHNLKEVAQAIQDYTEGKEPMLPGPDFPTGGEIINIKDFPAIMRTGHGSLKVRGRYNIEKNKIVFYEIPYGIKTEDLLKEIGGVCEKGEIIGIDDIQDQSNKKGLRIVIECEKKVSPQEIVNKLFAKTSLQSSFSYNQVALVDKKPTELNLEDCCKIYVEHNIDCLKKETQWDLEKAKERVNIINGLLIALEDIDNIISLIKSSTSSEDAKENLIKKYKLDEEQAKAILAMRLSSLARLEKVKLETEKKELLSKIGEWMTLLNEKDIQVKTILARLNAIVEKYGDDRRTVLSNVAEEKKNSPAIVEEKATIQYFKNGSIKVVKGETKVPKTASVLRQYISTTLDRIVFFTNQGRTYSCYIMDMEDGKNYLPKELVQLLSNEGVLVATSDKELKEQTYVLMITKSGMLKKSKTTEYNCRVAAKGTAAIKLKDGDSVVSVFFSSNENDRVFIRSNAGFYNFYDHSEIAAIGRASQGVKAIKLKDGEFVAETAIVREGENTEWKETSRAVKGNRA